MKLERGNFFHAVYRIQTKLGQTFRELEPYGLFPVDEYFHCSTPKVAASEPVRQKVVPIRPPLAAAAPVPQAA